MPRLRNAEYILIYALSVLHDFRKSWLTFATMSACDELWEALAVVLHKFVDADTGVCAGAHEVPHCQRNIERQFSDIVKQSVPPDVL